MPLLFTENENIHQLHVRFFTCISSSFSSACIWLSMLSWLKFWDTDHDAMGPHAMFTEHSAVSSGSHPCPYIAYVGPLHPSTSSSGGTVSEVSNFNHWNGGPPIHGDMSTSYTIPAVVLHYHSWDHPSSHFSSGSSHLGAADQPSVSQSNQRPTRGSSEAHRSGSYMHPFPVGHRYLY
jgi:hypothetical protein